MKKIFLIFILFAPSILFAQKINKDSIWLPLKPFIGVWTGEGEGEPGKGKYERTYAFILNNQFIEIHNKSVYPPTAQFPSGEIHEDRGYFSYDKIRKIFVLRQFHIEGFVNQFILDSISPDKTTIVFITEAIENIPTGWRAKETYHLLSANEMEEIFELAEPDKDFAVYTRVKLVRKK